jgi:FkbM family methyltransferase
MLIKLKDLCEKYKFIPQGIIHIGAHELEEMKDYLDLGIHNVLWIEGNPSLVDKNKHRIEGTNHNLIQGLIYDRDDVDLEFNITDNYQSSSVLKFGKHKEYHPTVNVTQTVTLKSKTIQSIFESNKFLPDLYDFVNLDIQGVELRAIKGFGKVLDSIKYIYTEVNTGQVYEDNDLITDIDYFLSERGFTRVETSLTNFEWGDAFYIKK